MWFIFTVWDRVSQSQHYWPLAPANSLVVGTFLCFQGKLPDHYPTRCQLAPSTCGDWNCLQTLPKVSCETKLPLVDSTGVWEDSCHHPHALNKKSLESDVASAYLHEPQSSYKAPLDLLWPLVFSSEHLKWRHARICLLVHADHTLLFRKSPPWGNNIRKENGKSIKDRDTDSSSSMSKRWLIMQ